VKTVLFVGAGRHQRSAILQARERGLRVVAIDRNAGAPGLQDADVAEVVDFADVRAAIEAARRNAVDGVLTVSADRAVPIVAAVAEALGLPGIGTETAHLMTNKVAMRRALEGADVPQPTFAAVHDLREGRAAVEATGLPAVLKPSDSSGQRGLFRLDSTADLETHLPESLAQSPSEEVIIERFHEGLEVNCLAVVRHGEVTVLTLSDRRRPTGIGFGVCLYHVFPSTIPGDVLTETVRVVADALRALGLRDSLAYPQLLVSADGVRVIEVAARIPGGQMAEVARLGVGVDLVEVALRQALGEDVPDELVLPRQAQPLAIRFFTADPGPLPTGKVRRVGGLERILSCPGVVRAESYIVPGETIRPVQLDGDRRGYVIALGETATEALERAEAAALTFDVEVEPL